MENDLRDENILFPGQKLSACSEFFLKKDNKHTNFPIYNTYKLLPADLKSFYQHQQ